MRQGKTLQEGQTHDLSLLVRIFKYMYMRIGFRFKLQQEQSSQEIFCKSFVKKQVSKKYFLKYSFSVCNG